MSFQLGLHLTQAVRKPWRLFVLPISFPWVTLNLGLEKIGKRSNSFHGELSREKDQTRKNCIVFFFQQMAWALVILQDCLQLQRP